MRHRTARASAEVRVATVQSAEGVADVVSPIHRGIGRSKDLQFMERSHGCKKGRP